MHMDFVQSSEPSPIIDANLLLESILRSDENFPKTPIEEDISKIILFLVSISMFIRNKKI